MNNKFENVSMNGRMAYVIMCVEKYLTNVHPQKDWKSLSRVLWRATNTNWGDWTDQYSGFIPEILLKYDSYDENELGLSFTKEDYYYLRDLYSGITEGNEDDPSDELNFILNKPFEMAMVYEGTVIGNGMESFKIIDEIENVLKVHSIPLPDYRKVEFSKSSELNGWGKDFDGSFLSIII
ncbi:hypothetical protein H8356DRAFT_1727174 [Neocallimastix lanati (nom. inval.)]|jgi:hypothetical protein|nr:hypothetical protein H8356DRAFT_1727174 [Neocallimastix sp. JGI-2020a]